MMEYKIKQTLIQAILNYLKQQPYEQVYGFINALMSCKPIEEKEE
jgi:hypothetical protein